MTTDKHNQGWAEYTNKLEKDNRILLRACKAALKDYQRVMDGRGMPSVIAMNKLEAAISDLTTPGQ